MRLVVTTDLKGSLEPCGCQNRPLGGLDRLAPLLAGAREDVRSTLVLAAGSTFFGAAALEPQELPQERIRARALAQVMRKIGLDAFAPGPADLAMGADELTRLSSAAGLEMLAGNVRAGSRSFAGQLVRDVGALRVGLFGVADLTGVNGGSQDLAFSESVSTARRLVDELRRAGAKVIIGLAAVGRRGATQLAQEVPGIDFLLVGGVALYPALPPEPSGGATLLFGGKLGQGVGIVDLYLHDGRARPGQPRFVDAGAQASAIAIGRIDRRIADLEARVRSWMEARGATEEQLAEIRRRLERLRAERIDLVRHEPPSDRSYFVSRWEELGPERPRDVAISAILKATDRQIAEANRAALANDRPLASVPGRPSYVGEAECESCHTEAAAFWNRTPHAEAWSTLEDAGKGLDLHCVGCHLTGYRQPGGSSALVNQHLRSVQCEVCHGPGSVHVDAGGEERPSSVQRSTTVATCTGCHNEEHSGGFNYARYLSKVVGIGHGR